MRKKLIFVTLIVFLIFITLSGCTASDTLSISNAVTCKNLDSDMKPIDKTDTFQAGTTDIYLTLIIHNLTPDDKLSVKWNYLDTSDEINTTDFTSPETLNANYIGFSINLPDGLPIGKYNAEIYLNDNLTETIEFSVQ